MKQTGKVLAGTFRSRQHFWMAEDKDSKQVTVTFQLVGDQYPHAWFFNKFRIDKVGESTLVTLGLVSEAGVLAVNAFVLTETDMRDNRARVVDFLGKTASEAGEPEAHKLGFSERPARVYPINHMNFSRVNHMGELGLFRHSVQTLVNHINEAKKNVGPAVVPAYPVVMFRADLKILLAFIKELYTS